jgi:hypothetical protein
MIRNTSFTQQTHFIGVPVPGDLSRMLLSCREYMGSIYGCRSGFTTPFHITLVPPFRLAPDFSDDDVKAAAEEASASCRASHITPFACIVKRIRQLLRPYAVCTCRAFFTVDAVPRRSVPRARCPLPRHRAQRHASVHAAPDCRQPGHSRRSRP